MEGIGILHGELTAAHHAVAGADFVSVLCVDLVEGEGQLLVGLKLVPHQGSKGFLGSGTHHQFLVHPVLHAEHSRSHGLPAAGLTPQLPWHHHGGLAFQRPDGIHFLTDNILHLAEGPQSQGKIGEQAVAQLANEPRPQHQLVAGDNSLCRHFPQSGNQCIGSFHIEGILQQTGDLVK